MSITIAATNRRIELRQTGISQTQYTLGRMADLIGNKGSLTLPSGERISGLQLRLFAMTALNEPALMDALEKIDAQDLLMFCDDMIKANGGNKLRVRHLEMPAVLATKGEYGKTEAALVVAEAPANPSAPAPPAPVAAPALSEGTVMAWVRNDPEYFQFAGDEWKSNEKVARLAVTGSWRQFAYAPSAVRDDPAVRTSVLDAIMARLPADLAGHREAFKGFIALQSCPTSLPAELMRPDVCAILMDLFPGSALGVLPRELLQNPETWVLYAAQTSYRATKKRGSEAIYSVIMADLKALTTSERSALFEDLKRTGISNLNRFGDLASLRRAIADRDSGSSPDKPLAIVVFPKSDHNGAFVRPAYIKDLQASYRVVYVEAGSDAEFISAVEKDWGKKAEVLLVGGHGYRLGTQFGDNTFDGFLDHGDMGRMKNLRTKLAPDSKVILYSCSTGEKAGNDANIANLMAWAFAGSQVYAPIEPSSAMKLTWENNRIKDVRFNVKRYTPRLPRL